MSIVSDLLSHDDIIELIEIHLSNILTYGATMTIQQFLQLMDELNVHYEKIDQENYWISTNGEYRIHFDTETSEIYPLTVNPITGDYSPITEEQLINNIRG